MIMNMTSTNLRRAMHLCSKRFSDGSKSFVLTDQPENFSAEYVTIALVEPGDVLRVVLNESDVVHDDYFYNFRAKAAIAGPSLLKAPVIMKPAGFRLPPPKKPSKAEELFKRAVTAVYEHGYFPGPTILNLVVHDRDSNDISGRECKWRREAVADLGYADVRSLSKITSSVRHLTDGDLQEIINTTFQL